MRHRHTKSVSVSVSASSSSFGGWKLIAAIAFALVSTIASAWYVTAKETDEKQTKENDRQAAVTKHRETNNKNNINESFESVISKEWKPQYNADEINPGKKSWDNAGFEEKDFKVTLTPAPAPAPVFVPAPVFAPAPVAVYAPVHTPVHATTVPVVPTVARTYNLQGAPPPGHQRI